VNRAAQGLYQPGAALETVVLAEALSRNLVSLYGFAPDLTATVTVNNFVLECRGEVSPEGELMLNAFRMACPGPFAALGEELGITGLRDGFTRWGLTEPPSLEIPTARREWSPQDARLEAVGQGGLTVSPLQMALVAAALANEGVIPVPHLVLEVEQADGLWRAPELPGKPRQAVPAELARAVLSAWEPMTSASGPEIRGHLGTAVAGERRPPHAWFLGVVRAGDNPYAVAVLLEHAPDPRSAAQVGMLLLRAAVR
jgi:peptidoglycan glycosyltransferase